MFYGSHLQLVSSMELIHYLSPVYVDPARIALFEIILLSDR